jgi:hypothetical protein
MEAVVVLPVVFAGVVRFVSSVLVVAGDVRVVLSVLAVVLPAVDAGEVRVVLLDLVVVCQPCLLEWLE